ncbi:hypothetical protein COP1_007487 [Malus domestica]
MSAAELGIDLYKTSFLFILLCQENNRKVKIAIIVALGIAIVVFSGVLLVGYFIRQRKRKNEANRNPITKIRERNQDNEGTPRGDMELPLFDPMTVASATYNFFKR